MHKPTPTPGGGSAFAHESASGSSSRWGSSALRRSLGERWEAVNSRIHGLQLLSELPIIRSDPALFDSIQWLVKECANLESQLMYAPEAELSEFQDDLINCETTQRIFEGECREMLSPTLTDLCGHQCQRAMDASFDLLREVHAAWRDSYPAESFRVRALAIRRRVDEIENSPGRATLEKLVQLLDVRRQMRHLDQDFRHTLNGSNVEIEGPEWRPPYSQLPPLPPNYVDRLHPAPDPTRSGLSRHIRRHIPERQPPAYQQHQHGSQYSIGRQEQQTGLSARRAVMYGF